MEDRLPHGNELLKQILLKGGVPRSSIRAKDMHIVMELDEKKRRRLVIPDIAFHRTSTRPIPLKPMPNPLGIITTVFQAHGDTSSPSPKAACMMAMNFSQFPGSGCSSQFAAQSHNLRCFSLILDGPPEQCIRSTTSEISSSLRILSSTWKGATSMGLGHPGGRMWV